MQENILMLFHFPKLVSLCWWIWKSEHNRAIATSQERLSARPVFHREDVFRMLLKRNGDSDAADEPFYYDSGSKYEQSEPDSDCNKGSRFRSLFCYDM